MNRIIDAIKQAHEDYQLKGGTGSGNFGHSGRPGAIGGSVGGAGMGGRNLDSMRPNNAIIKTVKTNAKLVDKASLIAGAKQVGETEFGKAPDNVGGYKLGRLIWDEPTDVKIVNIKKLATQVADDQGEDVHNVAIYDTDFGYVFSSDKQGKHTIVKNVETAEDAYNFYKANPDKLLHTYSATDVGELVTLVP